MGAEEVTFETTTESAVSTASLTTARAHVLTQEQHGQDEFQDTHAFTQTHMRERVVDQFPASFWDDVKQKRSKTEKTQESAQ